MKIKQIITNLLWRIDSILLGSLIDLFRANRKIKKGTSSITIDNILKDDLRLNLSKDLLENHLATGFQRLSRIEDKASRTLLGITTAITILGMWTGLINSSNVPLLERIILIMGIFYLLLSGYLALRAYEIGEIYTPSLNDSASSEEDYKRALLFYIKKNDDRALMRTNRLHVCFRTLRNGIIVIFLFTVLAVLSTSTYSITQSTKLPIQTQKPYLLPDTSCAESRNANRLLKNKIDSLEFRKTP